MSTPALIALELVALIVALVIGWNVARLLMLLAYALRARRRIRRQARRDRELVQARLAAVRELKAPDELEAAPDPSRGDVRRARQSRPHARRARKRRTGQWE